MKDNIFTIGYAAVLGIVCASVLAGMNVFTAPYKEANAKLEKVKNVLTVLEIPYDESSSAEQIMEVYKSEVQQNQTGGVTLYEYIPNGSDQREAAAVLFAGQGLWGPIKGFLALESDLRTVRGMTVFEQEETPGLGGEIGADWFKKQFEGKKIIGPDGIGGIKIVAAGTADEQNEVDGISGATMTSDKFETVLSDVIQKVLNEKNHG